MRPSTASRHLGAAKVLELLAAIDVTRARIISNHQIGGHVRAAASAGRVTIVPNEEALVRHALCNSSDSARGRHPDGDALTAPLSLSAHAATANPEAQR